MRFRSSLAVTAEETKVYSHALTLPGEGILKAANECTGNTRISYAHVFIFHLNCFCTSEIELTLEANIVFAASYAVDVQSCVKMERS